MNRGSGCGLRLVGCGFSLFFTLIIFGVIGYVFVRSGDLPADNPIGSLISSFTNIATSGQRTIIRPVVPITQGGDGLEAELLITNYQLSVGLAEFEDPAGAISSGIPVMMSATRMENGRRVIAWEIQVGTDEGGQQVNQAVGDSAVFLSVNNRLQAYDRQDGSSLWVATLSDAVDQYCTTCIQVVNNVVVVLSLDSVLQGFDTTSGNSLWAVRLNNATRAFSNKAIMQFAVVNGRIAILDQGKTDTGLITALIVLDAASGKLVQQIAPTCAGSNLLGAFEAALEDTATTAGEDTTAAFNEALSSVSSMLEGGLDSFSSILVDENTDTLYFLLGGMISPVCLQAWQLEQPQALWSTVLAENISLSFNNTAGLATPQTSAPFWVVGKDTLYIRISPSSQDSQVMVVDLKKGQIRFTLEENDYSLSPLAEENGIVVLRATKTRGSTQDELWGMDGETGQKLWQQTLQASHLLNSDIGIGTTWDFHMAPNGLAVLQLLPDPDRMIATVFNMADGAVLFTKTTNVGDDFWTYTTWTDDAAYLAIRDLFRVDLTSGETQREWP